MVSITKKIGDWALLILIFPILLAIVIFMVVFDIETSQKTWERKEWLALNKK